MEYDKEMASRVWKRVQGIAKPEMLDPSGQLWELIRDIRDTVLLYSQLVRHLSGESRQRVQTMFRQTQSQLDCLRGIYALQTGSKPQISKPQTEPVNPKELLRICYGRAMQAIARYEARAEDPEFGRIFRDMAVQTQGHSKLLLELLGHKN